MKTYPGFLKQVRKLGCMPKFSDRQLHGQYMCQTELLRMLRVVIRFCDEHNLKYFATGGTLLGAVREQGFIPHDGDIDIALVDDEYDFFYRNFPREIEGMWIANEGTDENTGKIYNKNHPFYAGDISSDDKGYVGVINRIISKRYAYNTWTQFDSWAKGIPYHCGVRIDVFKFRSDNPKPRKGFRNPLRKKEYILLNGEQYEFDVNMYIKLNKDLSHMSKLEAINHYKFHGIHEGRPHSKSESPDDIFSPMWRGNEWKKWEDQKFHLKRKHLFPLQRVKFEDLEITIPGEPETWLNHSWKNFKKPTKNGYPHEYPKNGCVIRLDKNDLPKMYDKHYKHLYRAAT